MPTSALILLRHCPQGPTGALALDALTLAARPSQQPCRDGTLPSATPARRGGSYPEGEPPGVRNERNLPEANLSNATQDRLSAIVCFANADKRCLSLRCKL